MEALLLEGSMLSCIENIVLSSMAFAPLCRVTSWTLQDVDWKDRAEMLMLITSYCTLPIQIFTRLWPMSSQPPLSLTLTASSEVRQGPWAIEAKSLPFSRASNLSEFHHWHHLKVYEWIQAQIWTDHRLMRPLNFSFNPHLRPLICRRPRMWQFFVCICNDFHILESFLIFLAIDMRFSI